MSDVEPFEMQKPEVEPAVELVVDLEGYEGPIDALLQLAREQKVDITKISILRSPTSTRLHRGGAPAAPGDRRRLPGDGGLACLSQIAPAAARAATGRRAERRGAGRRPRFPAPAPRSDAAGRRPADGARRSSAATSSRAARPRVCRAGVAHVYEATLYDLLKAYGDSQRRARGRRPPYRRAELYSMDDALAAARTAARQDAGLADAGELPAARLAAGAGASLRRCRHIRRDASSWSARASSSFARTSPFGPIYLRSLPNENT